MMKEKKMLQTRMSAGDYLAPKVKVVELKVRRVLCSSDVYNYISSTNTEESDYD